MAKITSPVAGFKGRVAGVDFKDGVAETDDPGALAYFRRKGYKVGSKQHEIPPQLQSLLVQPVPPDPLKQNVQLGTAVRDASVDPRPTDFLPPTNAGKANPHGPLVVAPEIHGAGDQVVRPGEVFVEDLAAQQKAETERAQAILVERKDVGDVTAAADDADRGELDLSDPGSAHIGKVTDSGNAVDAETPTNPDGSSSQPHTNQGEADASELKGKALDEALEAAGLPKTGTADEKRARLAEHGGA